MSDPSLTAILRLIRVEATVQARFTGVLGSLHGLSLNELVFLMSLDQAPLGRMRRVDLATTLVVSQSSVSRMAAPLEKIGLVARDSDERDARVAYVVLTDAGRARVKDATATLTELCQGVFAERFAASEIKNLAGLLGRLSTPL